MRCGLISNGKVGNFVLNGKSMTGQFTHVTAARTGSVSAIWCADKETLRGTNNTLHKRWGSQYIGKSYFPLGGR